MWYLKTKEKVIKNLDIYIYVLGVLEEDFFKKKLAIFIFHYNNHSDNLKTTFALKVSFFNTYLRTYMYVLGTLERYFPFLDANDIYLCQKHSQIVAHLSFWYKRNVFKN